MFLAYISPLAEDFSTSCPPLASIWPCPCFVAVLDNQEDELKRNHVLDLDATRAPVPCQMGTSAGLLKGAACMVASHRRARDREREQAGTRSASYDLASRAISSTCFLFVRSESLREAELGSSIGGHATHSVDIFKLSHCTLWTQVDVQTCSPPAQKSQPATALAPSPGLVIQVGGSFSR